MAAMPQTMSTPSPFQEPFIRTLDEATSANYRDEPNYFAKYPRSLITRSTVNSFMTGTGDAIYTSLAPLLESTNHELILVTCFWARSSTLEALNTVLRKLSNKAIHRGTEKIQVRLCFSSSSLLQKLFHNQSTTGQTYDSSSWTRKFGLPHPDELHGLDLQIKSVFILPFSVMHPKFIIIDRQTVVLPSCNISWEEWFEGAITLTGSVVSQFTKFYEEFWLRQPLLDLPAATNDDAKPWHADAAELQELGGANTIKYFSCTTKASEITNIPTIFLPSPHRRNPQFQPFASPEKIRAPPTPLNAFVLTLLAKSEKTVRIQSPNLTSPPILTAILNALQRGIDVSILTSARLMILEQLVTAGTTTSRCVNRLIKRYKRLAQPVERRPSTDEEAAIGSPRLGELRVSYFAAKGGSRKRGEEDGEPQQSHLKMMVVDGEVLVLGSGNLDRASWFTSQELGVAFFDKKLVEQVESVVDRAMEGRERLVYSSAQRT